MSVCNEHVTYKWLGPGQQHVNGVIEEQIEPEYPSTYYLDDSPMVGSLVLLLNTMYTLMSAASSM